MAAALSEVVFGTPVTLHHNKRLHNCEPDGRQLKERMEQLPTDPCLLLICQGRQIS